MKTSTMMREDEYEDTTIKIATMKKTTTSTATTTMMAMKSPCKRLLVRTSSQENPCERLLARDSLRETPPCEGFLARDSSQLIDSSRETPRERFLVRDSSRQTPRECGRETPCERLLSSRGIYCQRLLATPVSCDRFLARGCERLLTRGDSL